MLSVLFLWKCHFSSLKLSLIILGKGRAKQCFVKLRELELWIYFFNMELWFSYCYCMTTAKISLCPYTPESIFSPSVHSRDAGCQTHILSHWGLLTSALELNGIGGTWWLNDGSWIDRSHMIIFLAWFLKLSPKCLSSFLPCASLSHWWGLEFLLYKTRNLKDTWSSNYPPGRTFQAAIMKRTLYISFGYSSN